MNWQGCTGAGVQGCRGASVQGCKGALVLVPVLVLLLPLNVAAQDPLDRVMFAVRTAMAPAFT